MTAAWEFLSATKSVVGNHALGLLDLGKALVLPPSPGAPDGPQKGSPNARQFFPNISTTIFDELCCNLTAVLLNHIKDSVFFPGIKGLLYGAKSGPDDPGVCCSQLSGFATRCATSLGGGLYLGDTQLPQTFRQYLALKQRKVIGPMNEPLEGMWQDLLLVNSLNVLTWPVVAHRAMSVLAYVEAIQRHDQAVEYHINVSTGAREVLPSALKKGALLAIQIFNQFDDFGSGSDQDRALVLDLWLVLLNHPASGLVWESPGGMQKSQEPEMEKDKDSSLLSGLVEVEAKLVRGG